MQNPYRGHLAAVFTILVWGGTFVSTKVLLRHFTPEEILLLRFVLGLFTLFLMQPKRMPVQRKAHEWYFVSAGLTGIVLYYLCENIALEYGDASVVSVIVSAAPLFVGLFAALFLHERLTASFFAGFAVALAGVCLISFSGQGRPVVQPRGVLLSVAAAVAWGVFSILTGRIAELGYPTLGATRRIFRYGVLLMLPIVVLRGFRLTAVVTMNGIEAGNLLFLGMGASAICFATWNYAVKLLGSVKTSAYIYATPVMTVLIAAVALHERMTAQSALGAVLVLAGLVLSEGRRLPQKEGNTHGAV